MHTETGPCDDNTRHTNTAINVVTLWRYVICSAQLSAEL